VKSYALTLAPASTRGLNMDTLYRSAASASGAPIVASSPRCNKLSTCLEWYAAAYSRGVHPVRRRNILASVISVLLERPNSAAATGLESDCIPCHSR
ncbi:hypothetical protein BC835DRAFT_1362189, partial [Cytidiella melzeri]